MLFHVEMSVHIPATVAAATVERLKAEEKAVAEELQRRGVWRHLWRIVGCYANISVFEVQTAEELHAILSTLPLFPFMTLAVRALCRQPIVARSGQG